ncbi:hypothetical protein ACFLT2_04755 [Acidobacteriota bacterium]
MILSRIRIIHPLLFSIYPVLFLFSENISEVYVRDILIPLVLVLTLAFIIWVGVGIVLKNWYKAAFIASLSVLMLLFFRHAYEALLMLIRPTVISRGTVLAGWLIFYLILALVIMRIKGNMPLATKLANFLSVVLLVLACVNIVAFYLRPKLYGIRPQIERFTKLDQKDLSWIKKRQNLTGQKRPDVYYLILDGYGRADAIETHYGFDNRDFLDRLQSKGFHIYDRATSNYSYTHESITSSLNMDYIHDEHFEPERSQLPNLILHNKLAQLFRTLGYKYILVPSGFFITDRSPLADIKIDLEIWTQSQFLALLVESSALWFSWKWFNELSAARNEGIIVGAFEGKGIMAQWHRHIEGSIAEIPQIAQNSESTFTFAHIICPHPPYVFKRDGSLNTSAKMADLGGFDYFNYWHLSDQFVDQLIHFNKLIEEMLEKLLETSPEPPIIIVQGDHGTSYLGEEGGGATLSPSVAHINERMSILLACYAPEKVIDSLYDSVSPVNIFRVVLNECFDAGYELLPDRNYWSHGRPMIDVTDRVIK